MRMLILTAAALIGVTIATAAPVRADVEFPYCAIAGFGVGQDCSFYTREQCQAAVRGLGTDCESNPRFVRPSISTPAAGSGQGQRR